MSILHRNRVTSLGYLLSSSSKPASGSRTRTRRASVSFVASGLSSLPSCPILSTERDSSASEQEFDISKRARVTSAPFIRRNGDLVGQGDTQASTHGSYRHLQASKLVPLSPVAAVLSQPFSGSPSKQQPTQDRVTAIADIDISSEFSSISLRETEQKNLEGMPKAPQLSFRSPVSQPNMLPVLYSPIAKQPLSPQISYLAAPSGYSHSPRPLQTSQVATIAAVLEPHRRSPAPESRPALRLVRSTEDEHVLSVHLPGFAPEMVTICARREDKLAVVADLWHAEANCHHEWLVAFSSRDANVLQTRAQFSADGTLTIHVPRRVNGNCLWTRGRLR